MSDYMDLPEGMTCGDCLLWLRCKALISSLSASGTRCDWNPSHFVQARPSVVLLSRIRDLIAAGRDFTEAVERGEQKTRRPSRGPVRQRDEVMSWANAVIRMRRELERVGLAKAMDGIEREGGD